MTPMLQVAGLRVTGPKGVLVDGVSLTVGAGETLAIVGESGSGKSMTVKALTGLLPPGVTATGQLAFDGADLPLDGTGPAWSGVRGRQIALLPQDPFTSLSPVHRVGDQIAWTLAKRDRGRVPELLAEVGLGAEVARKRPFELSGGMRQRVALAAALAAGPRLLVADEPTTALDVTTQHEVLELLGGLLRDRGMGLILITHDLRLARSRADRLLVLYAGRPCEEGPAAEVMAEPAHPYTPRLAACDPPLGERLVLLPTIPGSVPPPFTVGAECAFAARCDLAGDDCRTGVPPYREIATGRRTACLNPSPFPTRDEVPREEPQAGEAGEVVLRVEELVKTFGGVPAVDGVGLDVRAGEIVAIVGESGSGKTTLARCIAGLEKPDAGTIDNGQERPQLVFQDPYSALNPGLSVGTQLEEALRAAGRPITEAAGLLELVGLPAGYAGRRPRALSGGERQRVSLARALAPGARLLICDEPVSALDVSVQAGVLNLLTRLRRELGLTILFITHDLAVARQIADRVHVMFRGRVVESGDAEAVLANPAHEYTRGLLASVPAAE